MKKTIRIEAENFCGTCIVGAKMLAGYGLENVTDVNTGRTYTIIFVGDKAYAYEEC